MTRIMNDAVTPSNIDPSKVQLVAGYLNGIYAWSAADWARFPNAVHVGISVRASYTQGHVLDVENGDATPAESVGWVQARRAAGADPTVYCNGSTWPLVRAAFQSAGVAEPHYWIAEYDGDPTLPAGVVAKQYLGDVAPGIDISSVADYWPGVDPAPVVSHASQSKEDLSMYVPAAADDYISVPANGALNLFVASHFGRSVKVIEAYAVGDTGTFITKLATPSVFNSDRPGPQGLPPNTRTVSLRYSADHPFTAWCA